MADKKRKAHWYKPKGATDRPAVGQGGAFWLYGLHAAKAALANPRRKVRRALLTPRAAQEIGAALLKNVAAERTETEAVGKALPLGSVHQGVALLCEPLPDLDLEEILTAVDERRIVAVLDQVTDPHNEGAILRSAAAFGIAAVVVQERHGAPESGALAKAASGALDIVPRVVVVNIARALEQLGRLGFWRIALSTDGSETLADAAPPGRDVVIVLGAEGSGLRRLVRERCDGSAFLPMRGAMESLNVSNAAAIAFYELSRKRP